MKSRTDQKTFFLKKAGILKATFPQMLEGTEKEDRRPTLRDKQPDTRHKTHRRSTPTETNTRQVQMAGQKRALTLREQDHGAEHLLNVALSLLMRCSALPRQAQFKDRDER